MRPFYLKAPVKDYIWGGTRLRELFGKEGGDRLAESWELSCHPDGECYIMGGEFDGMKLSDFVNEHPEAVGSGFKSGDSFPVLVKLIDAKNDLSVQVHPNDEYAHKYENDNGKTEMWYVIDAAPDSELIYGFNEELSKEDFRKAIENNTLMEKLRRVPVKQGDVFFIEPGTLHAIGKGILIAEIQQSSNVTYRVYDYGRLGADGKPRPLHIEKALEVTNTKPLDPERPVYGLELDGDFCDNEHMNVFGMEKFTAWFGQYLSEQYSLTAAHSDAVTAEWQRCAEFVAHMLPICKQKTPGDGGNYNEFSPEFLAYR